MIESVIQQTMTLQGRAYELSVFRRVTLPPAAPRLAVVSCLPNAMALRVLETCVHSLLQFSRMPVEIWVVDNASDPSLASELHSLHGVNLVLNGTPAIPPGAEDVVTSPVDFRWGSYANAIALEIAAALIDQKTERFGTFHMDTMAVHPAWLDFMLGKINGRVAAAGVRLDVTRTPSGVLHVLGMIVDFQLFRKLGLTFYPDLPKYDVGDLVTVGLRSAGYEVFASRNTLWDPALAGAIAADSEFNDWPVDRSLDDADAVFFLHLGRGVRKAVGESVRGMTAEEWVTRGERYLQKEARYASAG
jgi:hypothetical protein